MGARSPNAAPRPIGGLESSRLRAALQEQAHVWLFSSDEAVDPELADRLFALLDEEERQRHDRLRRAKDRQLFLVAHVARRLVLSRYLDLAPASLRFGVDGNGRPELTSDRTLGFNLSHTPGYVACLVSATPVCGVDVQAVDGVPDPLVVAETYCSKQERAWLRAQPAHEQRQRFFDLWTLKEAFLKARGTVELSPEAYTFDIGGEEKPIGISFAPSLEENSAAWEFELYRPTANHVLAIALRRDAVQGSLEVVFNEASELRSLLEPGGAR